MPNGTRKPPAGAPLRWRTVPLRGQTGPDLRIVQRSYNVAVRGEQGDHHMWVTTQDGELVNFSRMDAIWTQFYPKITPTDPDISYDVMCRGAGGAFVLGRFGSEGRALQVRNAVVAAETADTNYAVPVS